MKRTYKIGQIITLPAWKAERIPAMRVRVTGLPNRSGLMAVQGLKLDEEFEVAVSRKTGRVLNVYVDCGIPSF